MDNVGTARGTVMIEGWLKKRFRSIPTAAGAGMICTSMHRMNVRVSNFTPRENLKEGAKIYVKGTVERRADALILNTSSMDFIGIIPGAPEMAEDDMDEAVESPPLFAKREAQISPEESASKKRKSD